MPLFIFRSNGRRSHCQRALVSPAPHGEAGGTAACQSVLADLSSNHKRSDGACCRSALNARTPRVPRPVPLRFQARPAAFAASSRACQASLCAPRPRSELAFIKSRGGRRRRRTAWGSRQCTTGKAASQQLRFYSGEPNMRGLRTIPASMSAFTEPLLTSRHSRTREKCTTTGRRGGAGGCMQATRRRDGAPSGGSAAPPPHATGVRLPPDLHANP